MAGADVARGEQHRSALLGVADARWMDEQRSERMALVVLDLDSSWSWCVESERVGSARVADKHV